MRIIYGQTETLSKIAENLLTKEYGSVDFGKCKALGVTVGEGDEEQLEAVCVYHEYCPIQGTCMISFATFSPRWASKGIVKYLLGVPFKEYGVQKVWCSSSIHNKKCIKLLEGIGFKKEATLAHHLGRKNHALIYRMMVEDYNRIYQDE